jgi:ubiquinone/menaquinone biosynthesis C-methylase UbiE
MEITHGNFSSLAQDYASNRPSYSPEVRDAILGLMSTSNEFDFVDVGAGTGIWTRMLAPHAKTTIAIEPNNAMQKWGIRDNAQLKILWNFGHAEHTGLPDESADLICMASALHWADFNKATAEFHRVLRPGGRFCALWNTRQIDTNPLLIEIEATLGAMVPDLIRVSTGRSPFCNTLSARLSDCPIFETPIYLEGTHVEYMSPERYLGIWRSVNDVRVQLGEKRFQKFLRFVQQKTKGLRHIEATYQTRAWCSRVTKA